MSGYPDYGEMQQGIRKVHGVPQLDVINGLWCVLPSCTGATRKDTVNGCAAIVCTDCGHIYHISNNLSNNPSLRPECREDE